MIREKRSKRKDLIKHMAFVDYVLKTGTLNLYIRKQPVDEKRRQTRLEISVITSITSRDSIIRDFLWPGKLAD